VRGENQSKKCSYPLGHQEIEGPKISSNRHMKVESRRLPLPPREIFLFPISVRSYVDRSTIVRPEEESNPRPYGV